MKYHHIVAQWNVEGGKGKCTLLKFDKLIVLGESNFLALIDEETNEITIRKYGFQVMGVVHPVTYVNKLILFGKDKMILANAISDKILYEFPKLE